MQNVFIFDVAGVLRFYNGSAFFRWLDHTFHSPKNVSEVWKKWQNLRNIDAIDEHEFYSNFFRDIGVSESKMPEKVFYAKFFSDYVKDNKQILNFIKSYLYGKVELYIFSNLSRIDLEKNKEKIGFEYLFKKCIYSFDLGVKKPDITFFEKGLELIEHPGKDCIYFDDQLKNKENAEKLGIKFYQYTNFNQFLKDLRPYSLDLQTSAPRPTNLATTQEASKYAKTRSNQQT